MKTVEHECPQLHFRQLELSDVTAFHGFVQRNAERVVRFFPTTIRLNATHDATQLFVEDRIKKAIKKNWFTFVVDDLTNHKIVATIFMKEIDWNTKKAEVGYFVDGNYEGQGITTYALMRLVYFAFHHLCLNKLYLRISEDSLASCRVAEKCGFRKEGLIRADFKTATGELIDVAYYGLLAEDSHTAPALCDQGKKSHTMLPDL